VVTRYLTTITLSEALDLIRREFPPVIVSRSVPLMDSPGRRTAVPVFARYSVPETHLSAMDGIAVRSEDTAGASEQHPVTISRAARVNTGNVVPPEFDAVVMIEDVWEEHDHFIVRKAVSPWQHVRPAGEDIGESEMILPSRHQIRPFELGALAAYGLTEIEVISPGVGLIPTGSELVAHGTRPAPGQVVESNTVMAAAILTSLGARCHRYPMTPDEPGLIRDMVCKGIAENDILVISAGSSAGTKDYTADIIRERGEVLVHGVAIRPGKPVIIGKIDKKPVIGMPGYPLSAFTVIREIIMPLLAQYGLPVQKSDLLQAHLTSTIPKDPGTDEFVLLSVGKIDDRYVASPQSRGSGVQMSAVRANAYLHLPSAIEGYEAEEQVPVRLMSPRSSVEDALLVTGSHDPALDYLADLVQERDVELHSTHLGSMGGLLALKRRHCHAAPMHLLDEDGDYNTSYLRKLLPGEELVLLCVAGRQQGIVSRDGIGLDNLPGRLFINRQRGSGTRMLLDYELKKRGISPADIPGYEREATTHLAVALAVKTGEADAGMCVYSAAKALGLRFVPVADERYELVLRKRHLDDPRVRALFEVIKSDAFRSRLELLGGYDTTITGVTRELP
jgi:putative molybdopterin biosynthesis protein